MRWLSLILGAAAIAAAARIALNRSRASSHDLTPPVPPPAPPAPPSPAPAPLAGTPAPAPAPRDDPAPPPTEAGSAVSPAAATVQETQGDLMAGLREPPPDPEVEREVEAQLAASPLPVDEVVVEVRDRIVQLEGSVPDPETATLIGDEAAHVDGVQGLDNRLRPEREAAVEEPEPIQERRED